MNAEETESPAEELEVGLAEASADLVLGKSRDPVKIPEFLWWMRKILLKKDPGTILLPESFKVLDGVQTTCQPSDVSGNLPEGTSMLSSRSRFPASGPKSSHHPAAQRSPNT